MHVTERWSRTSEVLRAEGAGSRQRDLLVLTVADVDEELHEDGEPIDVLHPAPPGVRGGRDEAGHRQCVLQPAEVHLVTVEHETDVEQDVDVVGALVRLVGVDDVLGHESSDEEEMSTVLPDCEQERGVRRFRDAPRAPAPGVRNRVHETVPNVASRKSWAASRSRSDPETRSA